MSELGLSHVKGILLYGPPGVSCAQLLLAMCVHRQNLSLPTQSGLWALFSSISSMPFEGVVQFLSSSCL